MDCNYFKELVQDSLDGDISDEQLAKLNKHLKDCPECAKYYNELKKQTELLASLRPQRGSVDMLALRRARKKAREAKLRKALTIAGSCAAALVVCILSASFLFGMTGASDNAAESEFAKADMSFSDGAYSEESVARFVNEAPVEPAPADAMEMDVPSAEDDGSEEACDEPEEAPASQGEVRPSVMHNGTVYCSTGKQLSLAVAEEAIVGKISSSVPSQNWPETEGQANFDIVGALYAEITVDLEEPVEGIAVNIDNEWVFFEPLK
ncbi:MAG: zf-HC2 domain-containing protein [Christensenellaceae bacterium]|nr:zf-HC2 domain-containing protein [Christensenellaceae bacterium]